MFLQDYIKDWAAEGRCCFTLMEAEKKLKKNRSAIISSIQHLSQKKEIVSLAKGFYVIIPPEYKILGCIPAEQFIPYLMDYLQQPYYVGLLSAAQYHGSTHQAPQIFQVVIEKKHTPIHRGKIKIEFITNKYMKNMLTEKKTTSKSMINIATPETTAFDLVQYANRCGGLNHVLTVLEELIEKINFKKFEILLNTVKNNAIKQRLGFLFEKLNATELIKILKNHLKQQKRLDRIYLEPKLKNSSYEKYHVDWKLIENIILEGDE